jgi:hypothetical protein
LGTFFEVDGQPLYYILGSVEFGDTNFVLLRDDAHSTHHILCQRVITSELIHQVDLGQAVSPNPEFSHVNQEMRDRALELSQAIKSKPLRSGEFNVQQPIFGLGRLSIHHYFYETLPGLLQVSMSMDQSVPRNLATRQREYLETRRLLEGQWSEIAVEIPPRDFFDSQQKPILLAGVNFSQIEPEVATMLDRKVVWSASSPEIPQGLISSPVIWFDLSVLNRKWNIQQVFADLMDEFLKMYENPTFVLDGLTAPWHERRDPAPEPSWISDIHGINRAKLVSLDFARADEKIRWAFHADFYFASFTTGSMFLHRFASKPGVSMSAPRTTNSSRSHLHNGSWRKIIIPEDLFVWQDLDVNPAWASFELKSHDFVPWAIGKARDFLPALDRKQEN